MNANTLRPARRSTASRKTAAIVSWNSSAMRFTASAWSARVSDFSASVRISCIKVTTTLP